MKKLYLLAAFLLSTLSLLSCSSDNNENNDNPTNVKVTTSISEINAPVEGGEYDIEVTTTGKEWTAYFESNNNTAWLKLETSNTSSQKGSIHVSIPANKETNEATGTIYVKSGTGRASISVKQAGAMSISTTKLYSKKEGETFSVTVEASGNWSATASDSWLTAKKADATTLTITTAENTGNEERVGTVTVTNGSERAVIEVTQASPISIVSPLEGYHLVWHDEFEEGNVLNSDWVHEVKNDHWVNNELQNYRNGVADGKRVTEIKEGALHINCFKGSDGKIYSGRVYAKKNTGWTYGYVEARIKLPSGKGTWPAFWMMPVNFRSWPHDGEIDIMEEVGYHKDYVSSSLHADGHVHSNGTQVTKEVYCKGAEGEFHIYGMEWTAGYFQFYVDGKKTLYYENDGKGDYNWPYHTPFYVILNLAWGGDWGGSQGVNEAALPVTMEVDYVRVFQK